MKPQADKSAFFKLLGHSNPMSTQQDIVERLIPSEKDLWHGKWLATSDLVRDAITEIRHLRAELTAEREKVKTLRDDMSGIQQSSELKLRNLTNGCGNHGCVINPPTGMGTNASCQCLSRTELRRVIRGLRDRAAEAIAATEEPKHE